MTADKKFKRHWADDPRLGHYIDDGALFALMTVSRGLLAGAGKDSYALTARRPAEWDHKDMLKFLIDVSEVYDFPLKNHSVMIYAFTEEYEVPTIDDDGNIDPEYEQAWQEYTEKYREYEKCRKEHEHLPAGGLFECAAKFPQRPIKYGGAYKWALDRAQLKETEFDKTLARYFDGKFDTTDVQTVMRMSYKPIPEGTDENSDDFYQQQISESLIDWTSFDVDPGKEKASQIRQDIEKYLADFMAGRLQSNPRDRQIIGTHVRTNPNIFTFEKQKQMLIERLKEMQDNYGDTFVFENPFDAVDIEYGDKESVKALYAQRQFLFMHSMLAFEQLGYIKMQRLGNNWEWSESKPLRHEAKIELQEAFRQLAAPAQSNAILAFDPIKSRLYVRGIEVPIRKFSDQYHTLRIIFENPSDVAQEWFFSEIAERVDARNPDDKRYYNAAYQIRLKLAGKGLPDFFITTSQSAKINPLYLS